MNFALEPDGREYEWIDFRHTITVEEMLTLRKESAEVGERIDWPRLNEILEVRTSADPDHHPDSPLYVSVHVWYARRHAGEKLTFAEACRFAYDQFEWRPTEAELAELRASQAAKAAEAAGPTEPRAGDGRGVPKRASKKTSKSRSTTV